MINWFKKKNKEKKTEKEIEESAPAPASVLTAEIKPSSETALTDEIKPNVEKTATTVPDKKTPEAVNPPPLTYKEMRALKKSRYETDMLDNPRCTKAYLLKNKKTGQIVELRAFSSFHACNLIGWKPNKVVVLEEKDLTLHQSSTLLK